MKVHQHLVTRSIILIMLMMTLVGLSARLRADTQTTGMCGGASITIPFTDVPNTNIFFCAIAEAYFSGLTNGTSATTYTPSQAVPREQMAAFVTRTLNQSLKRGSRRAALGQFWNLSKPSLNGGFYVPDGQVNLIRSDGEDVYVAIGLPANQVWRLRAGSHHRETILSTYSGIENAYGIAITPIGVYVTGRTSPGRIYGFRRGLGSVSLSPIATVGNGPVGIAYDGERLWTANTDGNSVSIYNPNTLQNVTIPGFEFPLGILYDGSHIWVTNFHSDTLEKLDANGSVLQTVPVGDGPQLPMFDGANIWVPNNNGPSITVVRVKDGSGNPLASAFTLTTLTGNGLNGPVDVAFDGQRVLVTNFLGNSLSLWKATDLTPLGSVSTGNSQTSTPFGVCSDGVDFWVSFRGGASGGTFLKY